MTNLADTSPMPDKLLDLPDKQEKLIRLLMAQDDSKISVVLSPDMEPDRIMESLETCCRGLEKFDTITSALKPIIGRMLLIIREKSLYKPEFDSFKKFLVERVRGTFGVSKSNLYESMAIVSAFPDLAVEQYKNIGSTNLLLAAKFTSQSNPDHKKILGKAAELTTEQFRQWAEEKQYLEEGATEGATIVIKTSKKTAKRWASWVTNTAVIAWAESENPGVVLEAMISECSGMVDQNSQSIGNKTK